MKHIMISIKPEYVCKILNKEKLLEIRKSIPKCVLNGEECIVEIYCTKGEQILIFDSFSNVLPNYPKYTILSKEHKHYTPKLNGKVVAKFTLKAFETLKSIRYRENGAHYQYNEINDDILQKSCLTEEQILDYTNGKDLYAWHIEDLDIYDTPKELSEFKTLPCDKSENACANCKYLQVTNTPYAYETYCPIENGKTLTRPPQSWCYIEGEDDESICD